MTKHHENGNSLKWLLDAGCTSHIYKDTSNFTYHNNHESSVKICNKELMDTKGVGTVTTTAEFEVRPERNIFRDVLYSSGLMHNLQSVPKIQKNSFLLYFMRCKLVPLDCKELLESPRRKKKVLHKKPDMACMKFRCAYLSIMAPVLQWSFLEKTTLICCISASDTLVKTFQGSHVK